MAEKQIELLAAVILLAAAFGVIFRWFRYRAFLKNNNWNFEELEKRYPRPKRDSEGGVTASLETRFYFHDPFATVFLVVMVLIAFADSTNTGN